MTMVIPVPSALKASTALRFHDALTALDSEEDYIFDFGSVGHTDPFGLLFVSDAIAHFQRRQLLGSSTCKNHDREALGYQRHMGFFQACGFDHGAAPGQASGGNNYLPITHLRVGTLIEEARERLKPIGEIVEEHAQRMAVVLSRQSEGDVYETLVYSLREVMRNVVEHSDSETLQFCAQHWPTKSRVHLAILDRGRGIRSTLSRNPNLEISEDLDALKLSLMPGVSGRMFEGVRRRPNDVWQNSGYGLYMTSRLAIAGGSFLIISGNRAYALASQKTLDYPIHHFEGTALRVSLDTRQLSYVERRLQQFAEEGRAIARDFRVADSRNASVASTMIRQRFGSSQ